MKFALVNGIKKEPAPKLKGVCCNCGSIAQAKCGTRKIWHWAHATLQHCDPWWESETEWHRLWKGYFPCQNQEVIHFDDTTGEKHIADIKTDNRIVVEIQNSPMYELEMLSRERFYGKMMWIVNGEKFKNNFTILGTLPAPQSRIAQEVFFEQPTSEAWYVRKERYGKAKPSNDQNQPITDRVTFHLRSENPDYEEMLQSGGDISSCTIRLPMMEERNRVIQEVQANYIGHHLFIWKNPRNTWFQSTKPVFIDFGGNELWRLMDYDLRGLKCVRKISKAALIEKDGGCYVPSSSDNIYRSVIS